MSARINPERTLVGALLVLALVAGCQTVPAGEQAAPSDESEVGAGEAQSPSPAEFTLPRRCQDLLPRAEFEQLASGSISLLRGPGSGSTETVYPEGKSPQEERDGISCLFGNSDETQTYMLSVAPITTDSRGDIIDELLTQQLNPGQTADGALTYWIQGDQSTVPAIYNALHPDAWYEVLIFPGGRLAYEEASLLASQMRNHTIG